MGIRPIAAIIAVVAAALTVAGCGAGSSRPETAPPSTTLVIRASNNVAGTAVLTLRCDPSGGTLSDATAACARLSHAPLGVLLHPVAFRCPGGPLSPWDLHLTGRTGDRPVHVDIATCMTPQVRIIRLLGITTSQLLKSSRQAADARRPTLPTRSPHGGETSWAPRPIPCAGIKSRRTNQLRAIGCAARSGSVRANDLPPGVRGTVDFGLSLGTARSGAPTYGYVT